MPQQVEGTGLVDFSGEALPALWSRWEIRSQEMGRKRGENGRGTEIGI